MKAGKNPILVIITFEDGENDVLEVRSERRSALVFLELELYDEDKGVCRKNSKRNA